ncbi:helix-turn-helix transcriptional regulator [Bariatricus sp. SGI.154]|uniref:helix-turn-helix transcriptional regulator n=1 Tax=Bariatricus sp. SGI.154 TaxID=3420549 RepID=UPI003CFF0286
MAVQMQKLKTLYLMQILLERTDEENLLNATELCNILDQEYGVSVDRRTIYSEIDTLDKFGLDVVQKKGKNPGYYIASRQFELPELKLLVDAVQSSRFITEKKSGELIKKLEKLCSRAEAKALSKQVSISNRPKTENETIYYNVDQIHSAIYKNRQIAFQYAEWTMRKELHYRKDGAVYVISPWALTWGNENYYLVAYDENSGQIRHYRVDRMRHMQIREAERVGKEAFQNFDLAEFAKKTFGMYGGRDVEVVLLCHKQLAEVVLDRFGQETWMVPVDEEHFKARVLVAVSRQFFGWVAGVGSQMKIVGPEDVRREYKEYLEEILLDY